MTEVKEVAAAHAATVSVLEEPEPCTQGDCDEKALYLVECGILADDGSKTEGGFPLCREHVHDFLDHILDEGARV